MFMLSFMDMTEIYENEYAGRLDRCGIKSIYNYSRSNILIIFFFLYKDIMEHLSCSELKCFDWNGTETN